MMKLSASFGSRVLLWLISQANGPEFILKLALCADSEGMSIGFAREATCRNYTLTRRTLASLITLRLRRPESDFTIASWLSRDQGQKKANDQGDDLARPPIR